MENAEFHHQRRSVMQLIQQEAPHRTCHLRVTLRSGSAVWPWPGFCLRSHFQESGERRVTSLRCAGPRPPSTEGGRSGGPEVHLLTVRHRSGSGRKEPAGEESLPGHSPLWQNPGPPKGHSCQDEDDFLEDRVIICAGLFCKTKAKVDSCVNAVLGRRQQHNSLSFVEKSTK